MSPVTPQAPLSPGWARMRLGDLCEFRYGSALSASQRRSGTVPVYGSNGVVGTHDEALTSGPAIIVGRKGSIGEVHLSRSPCWPIDTTYFIERPKIDVDLAWLATALKTLDLSSLNKAAAVPGLNRVDAYSLEVLVPPLVQQERIVRSLAEQMAAVERARAAAEAQLEAAKAFKRACFRAAFESDATQDWDRVRLGDLALSIQNGVYKAAHYYGHGKPLLRMYNLQKDSWLLDLDRLALAELSASEAATFQVMPGDLLVSRVNSFELVGKCSLVDQLSAGFAFENMLIRVRLHERVEPLFIVQQMSTDHIRKQIGRVAKRAIGQASINSDDIRQLQLLLPPLSAQRQIASDLARRTSAVDGLKERLEMECEVIAKLPVALLRRVFSGEL